MFCPYLSRTFFLTVCGKGRCLSSFIPGIWFVCVRMYFSDTFPSLPLVTVILDMQKLSSCLDSLLPLIFAVFLGHLFSPVLTAGVVLKGRLVNIMYYV